MTLNETRQLVEHEARLLGPRLFEGMAIAIDQAETRATGLGRTKYPHLRPMIVRAELREYLETEGLPEGWAVDGNPTLMGQLFLKKPASGVKLRVLKERRRTYPGGVPTAGRSTRRRQDWATPLFPLSAMPDGAAPTVNELLLLWDYAYKKEVVEGFTMRVVHPIEAGEYGRAVRCDVDFAIEAGGSVFERLTFQGDNDEEDFFDADIDEAGADEAGADE